MFRYLDPRIPDLGVLELSQPLVYGKHGYIFSHDGFLLPEHSWYGTKITNMHLPQHLPTGTSLPGTSLSLASDFAGGSYGHYLLDSLSRMHLFLAAGFTLDAIDHVLCNRPPTAEDFAAAAVVVSPHGGVLADLVFCNPGTKVLELLPTDHPGPYYYTLSLAAGLDYRCLACRSLDERPDGGSRPSTADFTVDIGDLVAALAGMES